MKKLTNTETLIHPAKCYALINTDGNAIAYGRSLGQMWTAAKNQTGDTPKTMRENGYTVHAGQWQKK